MDTPEIRLRESPRVVVDGRARVQLMPAGSEIEARLVDLSATGMGLGTAATAAVGQRCTFVLSVDEGSVEGSGVVVWSRRARPDREDAPNLGVRFEPAGAVAALVERVMDRRPAPRPDPGPRPARPAASTLPLPALADEPPAPAVAGQGEADGYRDREPQAAAGSGRRAGWIAIGAVAAVLVVLAGFLLGRDGKPVPRAEAATASSAADRPAPAIAETPPVIEDALPVIEETATVIEEAAAAPVAESQPAPDGAAGRAVEQASRAEPAPTRSAEPDAPGGDRAAVASARRILAIEHESGPQGTSVTLRADAAFRREDVFAAMIGPDPPRYLLRLSGIDRVFRPATLEASAPLLDRVRTGLHQTPRGPQLHVVLDLPTRAVEHEWEIDGDTLRVHLRPRPP